MRKKDDTLHDTLVRVAQDIAQTQGIDAINIRSLAQKAGIAVGTVYNYFSNKDDILLALTEEFWKQTLLELKTAITADSFCGQLEEIFSFLKQRIDHSAGRLMGSLSNVQTSGQQRMTSMQGVLEEALLQRMELDARVRKDIWEKGFSKQEFARFMVMNITMLLRAKASDIAFFIQLIKRVIYE